MTSASADIVDLAEYRKRKEGEEIKTLNEQVSSLLGDISDLHKPFPYPESREYVSDIQADSGYELSFELGKRMKRLGDVLLTTITTIRTTKDKL